MEAATQSPLFTGTVRHTVDEKNRVTVPARWRDRDDPRFFAIFYEKDESVHLLPLWELERLQEKIQQLNIAAEKKNQMKRNLFAGAHECLLDKGGRIVVPEAFCRALGLNGEAVLSGLGTRIEMRSPASWEALNQGNSDPETSVGAVLDM